MSHDFRRLGILCVDDSGFLRSLLTDSLKALRVGHVHIAEDGRKAAAMLRRRAEDAVLALANPVDIIISNWQMPGADGLSFLKWVRSDDASPDRFAPFLMFTAFTDIEHVQIARDNGVDDIIAKPFSVNTIRDKILTLVMRDLVYVQTPQYFGPDRRRQTLDITGPDRRMLTETHADVEIITSIEDAQKAPMSPVRIYRLANPLRDRVGMPLGQSDVQKKDADAQLEKAQAVLDSYADKYPAYAEEQVLELLSLRRKIADVDLTNPDAAQTAQMLDGIKSITHDLMGQGSTFGFPLVTRAAKSLNMLAGKLTQLDGRKSELVQTHIRLLQLIMQEKRSGEDHPEVWEAIVGLEIAVQKCLA